MSESQDNPDRLLEITRRSERMIIYMAYPVLFGIFASADPLVKTLLLFPRINIGLGTSILRELRTEITFDPGRIHLRLFEN